MTYKQFISEKYNLMSIREISEELNIREESVRRIARSIGLTKRMKLEYVNFETSKNIDGFDSYVVTEDFLVVRKKDLVVMALNESADGYMMVKLTSNEGVRRTFQYHRLLAMLFIGLPEGYEMLQINHKDGNKKNNTLSNLEWMTPSENQKHAYDTGLKISAKGNRKYSDEDIIDVCKLLEIYSSPKKVYDILEGRINKTVIQQIYSKRRWKEISKNYNF